MTVRCDPEEQEIKYLFDFAEDFTNKHVLEIGCGDGRLTWQYAEKASQVIGIDPKPDCIATAIKETPLEFRDKVEFLACDLEEFTTQERFDLVILSWSL